MHRVANPSGTCVPTLALCERRRNDTGALMWRGLIGVAVLLASVAPWEVLAQSWTLTNVNVVDVPRARVLSNRGIRIRDGQITDVIPMTGLDAARDRSRVDGRGAFVIPGLYDMHVHLSPAGSARIVDSALSALVTTGVLGVRDMGFRLDSLATLAGIKQRRLDDRVAPRIWFVGPILNAPPLPPDYPPQVSATDPAAVRDLLERSQAQGSSAVKVHDRLTVASYRMIAAAAQAHGTAIVGHIPAVVPVEEVVRARQRSVEHLGGLAHGLLMACSIDSLAPARVAAAILPDDFLRLYRVIMGATHLTPLIDGFDPARCTRVASRLRAANVFQVPNLTLWQEWAVDTSERPAVNDLMARKRLFGALKELTSVIHRAGVPIMAGTDGVGSIHDELALLVEAGLAPIDALRAATSVPARFLGTANAGAVKSGFVADLVLLNGNPLADIRNTRRVLAVVFAGNLRGVAAGWVP